MIKGLLLVAVAVAFINVANVVVDVVVAGGTTVVGEVAGTVVEHSDLRKRTG